MLIKGDDLMTSVIDYIKWRGDVDFTASPFNDIDALVFAELVYLPLEDIVSEKLSDRGSSLSEVKERFFEIHPENARFGAIIPSEHIIDLFKAASESERFKNVAVRGFINRICVDAEKQLCAVCFDINKSTTVVCFRGTDDTIIGWKENLNMSFYAPIPAQKEAAEYLEEAVKQRSGKIFVTGHSKGGNLAVYSSLSASSKAKKRIEAVYNLDGPGFRRAFIERYKDDELGERIKNIMPDGATVGAIFNQVGKIHYIKSSAKGLYQHDGFSWMVLGKSFISASEPKKTTTEVHDFLEVWVEKMTDEEKADFAEAVYKVCSANEATTLSDIASDKFKFIISMLKTDDKTKKTFFKAMNMIIKERFKKNKK